MMNFRLFAALFFCSCFWLKTHAAFDTNNVRASLDIGSTFMGKSYTDDDALSVGPVAGGSLFNAALQGLNPALEIDALIVYSNLIIFSTDIGFVESSTTYNDEDLVAFDAITETFSMYFEGAANGIDSRADLDAATLLPGSTTLLFSVDISITGLVAGMTITDEDIVQFASGTATLAFDGDVTLGIDPTADLDALHSDGSNLYFSLDKSSTNAIVAGTGEDDDVWCINTNTLTTGILITGFGFESRADIVGLDEPRFSDEDALSDFEEITGVDDPATAVSATFPIDPEGTMSNPFLTDTDGDGVSDSDEAIAGTSAASSNDLLVITGISRENGTNYITWASVTNRSYELRNTTDAASYTNLVAEGINPENTTGTYLHTTSVNSQLLYSVTIDVTP
jgi:hypothetical protein